jgi:hypothetical protein
VAFSLITASHDDNLGGAARCCPLLPDQRLSS